MTRLLLALAALMLGAAWLAPLWHIGLHAPQYPEGIGMYVWIDTITGQKPNDLNSINGLNHYIGMKAIVPESIPELRLMPRLVGGLILLGLAAAAVGRRAGRYAWTTTLVLVAAAGLVDFYVWGYDYGHDLDPTAAIKIPGLSYQPPILGSKQLLNFTATSWPGAGGWAIAGALATGVALCVIEVRRRPARLVGVVGLAAVVGGCAPTGPVAFHYDTDACDHCRMAIAEPAFAAQLLTATGKVHRFDDPGCLLQFLKGGAVAAGDVRGIWFNDHAHAGQFVAAADAVILRSPRLGAPMNGGLAAFAARADAIALQERSGGTLTTWPAVQAGGAS
jgi:copper chaperone NosL